MKIIRQAYDDKSHCDIFEELQGEITWGALRPDSYDGWTLTCLNMARQISELQEADLLVHEPDSDAPPTREFKIVEPTGQAHYLIVVPLLEISFWVNKEHTGTIHPDIVLAESLPIPATVIIDDKKGSIIHVRNGPTIVDPRTADDRRRAAKRRRERNFPRGNSGPDL